jgi:hypothetical protein
MVVACEQVWREVSNYLEGDIAPELRAAVDEHSRTCPRCRAVLVGTRNVVQIYGDERMVDVPLGFSHRLRRKLEENMPRRRSKAWGWVIGFAAAVALILVMIEVGKPPAARQPLLAELAQPGYNVPPNMMVVVAAKGKTFHVSGCRFIHDKANLRTMTAAEAMREGYVPCVRCLRKYVTEAEAKALEQLEKNDEFAESE